MLSSLDKFSLNLQFNNFSSQISAMRKDSHLHWHDASVIFHHAEILGKAGKGEKLLTLSLLLLLHRNTRAVPTPPPCTQQKEEETDGIIRPLPLREFHTVSSTHQHFCIQQAGLQ